MPSICMDVKCPSSGEKSDLSLLAAIRPRGQREVRGRGRGGLPVRAGVMRGPPHRRRVFFSPVYGTDYQPSSGLHPRKQPARPVPGPAAQDARGEMMKAVCLISGGMDSSTLAYLAKSKGYDILALHANYGQRTENKERACAKKIAGLLGARGLYRDRPPVFPAVRGEQPDRPRDRGRPVRPGPGARPQHLRPVPEREPARHRDEFCRGKRGRCHLYRRAGARLFRVPDCRPAFIDAFRRVIELGTKETTHIGLFTPFIHMTKTDILKVGKELRRPLRAHVVVLPERGESLRDLRLVPFPARGIFRARDDRPDPVRGVKMEIFRGRRLWIEKSNRPVPERGRGGEGDRAPRAVRSRSSRSRRPGTGSCASTGTRSTSISTRHRPGRWKTGRTRQTTAHRELDRGGRCCGKNDDPERLHLHHARVSPMRRSGSLRPGTSYPPGNSKKTRMR